MDYKNLDSLGKDIEVIEKSPIWINNFVIETEKLLENKDNHYNS